jgi:hypothetical protein
MNAPSDQPVKWEVCAHLAMESKRDMLIILVLITMACLLGAVALRPPKRSEITYKGRPVRAWVNDYARKHIPPSVGAADPGLAPILVLGTNAVPFLLEVEAARIPIPMRVYMRLWPAKCYSQADVVNNVDLALRLIGTPVIPALANGLQSTDPWIRQAAAGSLGSCDFAAEQAVPLLTGSLTNQDFMTWGAAADALGRLGRKAKPAVGMLLERARTGSHFMAIYVPTLAISRIEPTNGAFQSTLSGWLVATNIPGLNRRETMFLQQEIQAMAGRSP